MGPRPRGRGIPRKGGRGLYLESLQWGRDRAVAELQMALALTAPVGPLQWGRDRAVAELLSLGAALHLRDDASMGPRPRGRGIGTGPVGHRDFQVLQWGRDRAVAELAEVQMVLR